MNEIKFKNLEDIGNLKIRFKHYTDERDGYQATFHIYDKLNPEIHYQVNFYISGTEYSSDITNSGKSLRVYINEEYGDLENCFEQIGVGYLEKQISNNNPRDENISLVKYLV